VARFWLAPTDKGMPAKLADRFDQLGVVIQPLRILFQHLVASAVLADLKGIGPNTGRQIVEPVLPANIDPLDVTVAVTPMNHRVA